MRIKFVFTGFMMVVFALPFGQVADIAHIGQTKTSKREQKRKAHTVQSENSSTVDALADSETPKLSLASPSPQLTVETEIQVHLQNVTGKVVTPPPRLHVHA